MPGTFTDIKMRRSGTRFQRHCCAGSPPPYAAPLLGRPVIKSQQSVKPASSLLKPFLLGTASPWSNLAAIPPGLASFLLCGRSSRAFRIAAVRPRQKRRKAFRASRTQRSRAVGAECVRTSQPHTAPVCAPHQRRGIIPQFEGQYQFAKTIISRINVSASLTPLGRPGPGRGGRLPTLRAGLFRCFREPVVSLPRRSRARRPHTQDRLRGHAPLRSAPYGTARLLAGTHKAHAYHPAG